ncbi:YfbK domain-containing protein [Aristaeella lactis]|uniref:Ca-activated chloride channel family protein n=1 Tax=Aristaeella lactis TaxID=3046383 RepID=A0AC61PPY4_9FIRM|nr:von Willebrand factor type A domain-containing protein [Aristaeella lactis]QUA54222.1 von Willebrand factor type A domain-containing protein [Aristaeella lactis]SMC87381.1 Ca-activated chloride channel family protein [Aristaeella lactis]
MKRIIAIILAALMVFAAAASAMGEENKIWKKGDQGEKVTWIQTRLKELEYLEKEPDGIFDEETEMALMAFQWDQGLLKSGMADSITMKVLETATETKTEAHSCYDLDYWEEAVCYEAEYAPSATASMAMPSATSNKADSWKWNTEEYTTFESNRFLSVLTSPLSTFAADVDTSSYALLRRKILSGERIPANSIRIEEMLNYFSYDYAKPQNGEPFGVTTEIAPCPWNAKTRLMLIGLQAEEVKKDERPGHNLVFLIDTSGSMFGSDRLDLVKRAFMLLLEELDPEDTVSIVTYASNDRVVLEGTPAADKTRIMEAISELEARGSTNGSAGILRAYEIAAKYYREGGVNRILLATDGDLNVGVTSEGELTRLVTEKRESGISLTCLGFGMGNYKDNKMEALADYGNGNCRYIDTIYEARKALVEEGGGTFITVAKDVKIQVDFNPAKVKGYRLIGYEDRVMAAEDFANDEKDGGEIGSGHRMTALYEIIPADSDFEFGEAESRYQNAQVSDAAEKTDWLTVSIRAKEPEGTVSKLYEYPVTDEAVKENMSENLRFAAAVAEAGMLLRESEWKGTATYTQALELVRGCESVSGDAYKEEFVYLLTLLERSH